MVNSDRLLTRACFVLDADNRAGLPAGFYTAIAIGTGFELRLVSQNNIIVENTLTNKELVELIFSPALLEKK